MITGSKLAELSGMTSIAYWKKELEKNGMIAEIKPSGRVLYKPESVEFLQNRQKNRNNTQGKNSNAFKHKFLKEKLKELGFNPIRVFYTVHRNKKNMPEKGWYYENNQGHILFLGSNYKIASDNLVFKRLAE